MVEITSEPIDVNATMESVRSNQSGAVCVFQGTVRDVHNGRQVAFLDYEAYGVMAEQKMKVIEQRIRKRWPVANCHLVHRTGHLELGEVSVVVAVSSAHREDAFEACRFGIEAIKAEVPIWKKESFVDGTTEWVDPTAGGDAAGRVG